MLHDVDNTRAHIIRELWYQGDLSYLLHKGQHLINQAYNSVFRQIFVACVSRQYGKTFWACVKCSETAYKKPNSRIKYGTAIHTDLMQFVKPAFDMILEDCPPELKPDYNSKYSQYIFPNGSIVHLVGLDKRPDSMRGNSLDLVVIDESGFVAKLDYIYKSVIIPATTHRPDCKVILISTPPKTPAHDFVDYCHKAQIENAYITLDIHQNPIIDARTIERLKHESGGEHTTTWRREYLCEFVTDDDSKIIKEWDKSCVQEIERDAFYECYHKYVGMDLGVHDLTAGLFGYYDFKRAALVIEDEIEMSGPDMNTSVLGALIKSKEAELWTINNEVQKPYRRIADNNWPLMITDMSLLHDLLFIPTTKENLEAMVNEVRILCMSKQLIVHPRCKKLIGCLEYGVWDEKRRQFARSKTYGHFDHLAALIYLVRFLDKTTNPIPSDFGKENHKAWLLHAREQEDKREVGKKLANAIYPASVRKQNGSR